jgi:hypothetical protein
MEVHTLTELQYAEPEKDAAYRLYIYGRDGYHSGCQWFRNKPKYPNEEITTEQAKKRVKAAIAQRKEVRITDGGDMLVFHAANGVILHPEKNDDFWEKL